MTEDTAEQTEVFCPCCSDYCCCDDESFAANLTSSRRSRTSKALMVVGAAAVVAGVAAVVVAATRPDVRARAAEVSKPAAGRALSAGRAALARAKDFPVDEVVQEYFLVR